eukprot:6206657-Pleurochrysis_carterae.AAC.5
MAAAASGRDPKTPGAQREGRTLASSARSGIERISKLRPGRTRRRPRPPKVIKAGQLSRTVGVLRPNDAPPNEIVSSHYTLLSFVPITLFNLLHPTKAFANFYFLCIGFLQLV